jgi:hypothetical protein
MLQRIKQAQPAKMKSEKKKNKQRKYAQLNPIFYAKKIDFQYPNPNPETQGNSK